MGAKWTTGTVLGYGLIAAGIGMFVWSAGIDVEYYFSSASTNLGAWGSAGASVFFHLVVLLFSGAVGCLLFGGKGWWKLLSLPAAAVLTGFLTFNVVSVMSFQAREYITPVKQAETALKAQIDASAEAGAKQEQRQLDAIEGLRKEATLAAAAVKLARTKEERTAALETLREANAAYKDAAFAPVQSVALPTTQAKVDPQAEAVATVLAMAGFTVTTEQIQLGFAGYRSLGLNFGKVFCWFFGFALLAMRRPEEPERAALPAPVVVSDAQEAPAALARAPLSLVPAQPTAKLYAYPTPAAAEPSEEHGEPEQIPSLERVKMWKNEVTRRQLGAAIRATVMHQHFNDWCDLQGYPRLNPNAFGRHLTALGFRRREVNVKNLPVTYLDVALCQLDDDDVLLTKQA